MKRPKSTITNHKDISVGELEAEVIKLAKDVVNTSVTPPLDNIEGMSYMLPYITIGQDIPKLTSYSMVALGAGPNNVSSQRAVMLFSFLLQAIETSKLELSYRLTSLDMNTELCRALLTIPKNSMYVSELYHNADRWFTYDIELSDGKRKRYVVNLTGSEDNTGKYRYERIVNEDALTRLAAGEKFTEDIKIITSPAVRTFNDTDFIAMGVNANTMFHIAAANEEDAVTISSSFARSTEVVTYETLTMEIPNNQRIISKNVGYDMLGAEVDLLPIGSTVVPGQILFGGTVVPSKYINSLQDVLPKTDTFTMDDEYLRTVKGGVIHSYRIDSSVSHKDINSNFKGGLNRLAKENEEYYNEIREEYDQVEDEIESGDLLLDNVAAEHYSYAKLYDTQQSLIYGTRMYLRLTVTIMNVRYLCEGDKITTKAASKGMVTKVMPTRYMPIDSDGISAEVSIPSSSVSNRMNPDNIYENLVSGSTKRLNDYVKSIDKSLPDIDKLKLLDKVKTHYNEVMLVEPTDEELLGLLDEEIIPMIVDPTNVDTNNILAYDINRRVIEHSPFMPSEKVTFFNPITGEPFEGRGMVGNNNLLILGKDASQFKASAGIALNPLMLPKSPSKSITNKTGYSVNGCKAVSEVESILYSALTGGEYLEILRHSATSKDYIENFTKDVSAAKNPFFVTLDEETVTPFGSESGISLIRSLHCGTHGYKYVKRKALIPSDVKDGIIKDEYYDKN